MSSKEFENRMRILAAMQPNFQIIRETPNLTYVRINGKEFWFSYNLLVAFSKDNVLVILTGVSPSTTKHTNIIIEREKNFYVQVIKTHDYEAFNSMLEVYNTWVK
jgi:hypothetical protein